METNNDFRLGVGSDGDRLRQGNNGSDRARINPALPIVSTACT
ncbi:hypothetical protein [Bifidobacterium asteroides]|nr:hypothetical protein [Bifidobacterium asteroides]